jgi:hypothetical protein
MSASLYDEPTKKPRRVPVAPAPVTGTTIPASASTTPNGHGRTGLTKSQLEAIPKARMEELTRVEAFSVVTDSELAETTYDRSRKEPLAYLFSSADGKHRTASALLDGNTLYTPSADINGMIRKGVIRFPSAAAEYDSELALVAAIQSFVRRYADLPPLWERLASYYVLLTWIFDKFAALPYLRFLGEWQSGKSRLAGVVASLCYRVTSISGATSPAAMYRLIERFRGTLSIDEADYQSSDLWSEVIKVINSGYMVGNYVVKCDAANNPEAFDTFGPKILSTRKPFTDQATNSRCLTLMVYQKQKIRPDIPLQLPGNFGAEAQELRNMLLTWRFRNYHKISIDRSIESKLAGLEPRMIQILSPLVAVSAADLDFHTELKTFFTRYAAEQRADSPQALIVEAIRELAGANPGKTLRVKDVAQRATELRLAQEPEAEVEAIKQGKTAQGDDSPRFNERRTGHLLRSLGFTTVRTRNGYVLAVSAEQLRALAERFPPLASGRVSLL